MPSSLLGSESFGVSSEITSSDASPSKTLKPSGPADKNVTSQPANLSSVPSSSPTTTKTASSSSTATGASRSGSNVNLARQLFPPSAFAHPSPPPSSFGPHSSSPMFAHPAPPSLPYLPAPGPYPPSHPPYPPPDLDLMSFQLKQLLKISQP
eukprot:TRINITY_DN637_c0_g1_i1.p1 TRINITY_DN637_c0_g1~~TRINITY_DN637_c0_g1_i1.p1  ORF type:complete len:152 (-),score=11.54 TRINITY_DN637_c0_g1_i1:38-493(-)